MGVQQFCFIYDETCTEGSAITKILQHKVPISFISVQCSGLCARHENSALDVSACYLSNPFISPTPDCFQLKDLQSCTEANT